MLRLTILILGLCAGLNSAGFLKSLTTSGLTGSPLVFSGSSGYATGAGGVLLAGPQAAGEVIVGGASAATPIVSSFGPSLGSSFGSSLGSSFGPSFGSSFGSSAVIPAGGPVVVGSSAGYPLASSVQNVYQEQTRVIPGEEVIYKVKQQPKVQKYVALVGQVVAQPKVVVSEVVKPKVEHVTLVQEPQPHVLNVQPEIHKETVEVIQPKYEVKPKAYLSQKHKQTIAKRFETEQNKLIASGGEHSGFADAPLKILLGGSAPSTGSYTTISGHANGHHNPLLGTGSTTYTTTGVNGGADYPSGTHHTSFGVGGLPKHTTYQTTTYENGPSGHLGGAGGHHTTTTTFGSGAPHSWAGTTNNAHLNLGTASSDKFGTKI